MAAKTMSLPKSSSKTCFVISPIGKPESEVRRLADDLYELVIIPALEKYGFEVVRADKIPRPGVITSEIVHLVQNAELCIIDLTGHNANVFYECGRRHETGKPFIQVIRKGDELPFDVSGIRTIFYDVSSARTTKESVDEIRKYVDEFESAGYASTSGGASLSSLAQSVERIERKLAQMAGSGTLMPNLGFTGKIDLDPLAALRNPREAFMKAIATNDVAAAIAILPKLKERLGVTEEFLAAAGYVALSGEEIGAITILDTLRENKDSLSVESIKAGFGALVQYYSNTDRETEAVTILPPLLEELLAGKDVSNEDKAWLLNQLQKLYYGAQDYESALEGARQVVENVPDDPAYIFNLSLIYEKLGQKKESLKLVDQYMTLDQIDAAHLMHAVDSYIEADRTADAKVAFNRLVELDPTSAKLLAMRGGKEFRRVIEG